MSGFGARFAIEVAFLALLALAVGLAELSTAWIVAVMAVGWVLVALVEWLAWRSESVGDAPRAAEPAGEAEVSTGQWDLDEILAPLPDEPSSTTILPGDKE